MNEQNHCDTCLNQHTDKCNHCMVAEYHGQKVGNPTGYEQKSCDDAISRKAAIKIAKCISKKAMPKYLEQLPSVQPSRKRGCWVSIDEEPHEEWECDKCGFVIDGSGCIDPIEYRDIYKFCPNCGADMRGDTE